VAAQGVRLQVGRPQLVQPAPNTNDEQRIPLCRQDLLVVVRCCSCPMRSVQGRWVGLQSCPAGVGPAWARWFVGARL